LAMLSMWHLAGSKLGLNGALPPGIDIDEYPHRGENGNQGASAVTQKWQRNTRHGNYPHIHAYVYKSLHEEHDQDSYRDQIAEIVRSQLGNPPDPIKNRPEKSYHEN
ncbi:MAG: hypothetical protein ACD_28C00191G0001, partial [uncultured bacterium]